MDDLIRRKAAIDEIDEWIKAFLEQGHKESAADACLIQDGIIQLPSVQQWIPCSERLPDDNVPVNITWVNHDPEPYYSDIKDKPFSATAVYYQGKWYWYSSTIEDYLMEYGRAEWDEIEEAMHNSIEVIAWMPLPEPYKGEQE